MWTVKTVDTYKTAKVAKLLKEGFEPFAVVNTNKVRDGKYVLRMYLKKNDQKPKEENRQITISEKVLDEIKKLPIRFAEEVVELMPQPVEASLERIIDEPTAAPQALGERRKVNEDDGSELLEKKETITQEAEQRVMLMKEREAPKGDNFRVVDEVPEPSFKRAESQEAAIEEIKTKHKGVGGLTISPMQEDGSVNVYMGNMRYHVEEDGQYTSEETKAGTSSLGVT